MTESTPELPTHSRGDETPSTAVAYEPANPNAGIATWRKALLLAIFSFSNFCDIYNNSSIFPAFPSIVAEFEMLPGETQWILTAYELTFASFLLLSGRLSDVYSPKPIFIMGLLLNGTMALGAGLIGVSSIAPVGSLVSNRKVGLLIFRAFQGIGAAFTIPSSLGLLVRLFPQPAEQGRAIGVFGGLGAIGNLAGLFIGALFVQLATWQWLFWFITIATLPLAITCMFLIPKQPVNVPLLEENGKESAKWRTLDLVGVTIVTVAVILFILGVTSSTNVGGWGTPLVLAPLILSIALIAAFFFYETRIDPKKAALPPHVWWYTNFAVLFVVAFLPYAYWTVVFVVFTTRWQDTFHWTPLFAAVHCLWLSVPGGALIAAGGYLGKFITTKQELVGGNFLMAISCVLLSFADREDQYWQYAFPGFLLGTAGAALCLVGANIAIFQSAPPTMAGVVGGCFNAALQLGQALLLACSTSIWTSVGNTAAASRGETPETYTGFEGYSAAFLFLMGVSVLETVGSAIFFKTPVPPKEDSEAAVEDEKEQQGESIVQGA